MSMIFKGSEIGDITLSVQRKNTGSAEFSGRLVALKPSLCVNNEPIVSVLQGQISTECRQNTYYLRSISIITGGVSASTFYNLEHENQKRAWKALAEVFIELTVQGKVETSGHIDWTKSFKGNNNVVDIKVGTVKKTTKMVTTTTTTTTRRVDKPMYIRRRTKKPTEEHLTSLKDKIKAIAAKTYKSTIPLIGKEEKEVEVEVNSTSGADEEYWRDCGLA